MPLRDKAIEQLGDSIEHGILFRSQLIKKARYSSATTSDSSRVKP